MREENEEDVTSTTEKPATPKQRVLVTRADQESEIRMGTVGMSGRAPETVYQVFDSTVSRFPDTDALCVKREGQWRKWTYAQYMEDVRRAAKSLIKVTEFRNFFIAVVESRDAYKFVTNWKARDGNWKSRDFRSDWNRSVESALWDSTLLNGSLQTWLQSMQGKSATCLWFRTAGCCVVVDC